MITHFANVDPMGEFFKYTKHCPSRPPPSPEFNAIRNCYFPAHRLSRYHRSLVPINFLNCITLNFATEILKIYFTTSIFIVVLFIRKNNNKNYTCIIFKSCKNHYGRGDFIDPGAEAGGESLSRHSLSSTLLEIVTSVHVGYHVITVGWFLSIS